MTNKIIPYGKQDISKEDIEAVINVLNSDFLTQGPVVGIFENHIKKYCNVSFAISCNSATSALHMACMALELGSSDYLWTSPNTFVASANCALYCGAKVDFVDIDPNTYNISIEKLRDKLISAQKINKLPKIIIPVHFAGQSCEMKELYDLSLEFNFKIIEDGSHAIGGRYLNLNIGNCKYSHITVFSFHPVKIITTGEGGICVTNDNNLADRLRKFSSHGITNNQKELSIKPSDEIWNYQQLLLGYNYRMNDIQAALGVSQFKRLNEFIDRRHQIANIYNTELRNLPIQLPWQHPDTFSSFHLYPIRINAEETKVTQKKVFEILKENSIMANLHYIPVYNQPFYQNLGFKPGYCIESEKHHKTTISIPIYYSFSEIDQSFVIEAIKKAFK